jgi:hypothetical protein
MVDYNPKTFWYYPWGKSITHKGVDIFANEGRNLYPSTAGLIIYSGKIDIGGNVIFVLGPKWRFHYYAHLQKCDIKSLIWVTRDKIIGKVGSSSNAWFYKFIRLNSYADMINRKHIKVNTGWQIVLSICLNGA